MKLGVALFTLTIVILMTGCSEKESENEQIARALNYLQHRPVMFTTEADDAWRASKFFLDLPYSDMDKTSLIQINEDHTITLFNHTDDCQHQGSYGLQAIQTSAGVWSDLSFSDIRWLSPSDGEFGTTDAYWMRIIFNEEIQVITEWFTCDEIPVPEYKPAQVVLQSVVFTFSTMEERDTYMDHLWILINAEY